MPNLNDLTCDDVLRTIELCNALGRGVFRNRYGYGPSLRYVLRFRGRSYDSKHDVSARRGGKERERMSGLRIGDTVAGTYCGVEFEGVITGYNGAGFVYIRTDFDFRGERRIKIGLDRRDLARTPLRLVEAGSVTADDLEEGSFCGLRLRGDR